MPKVYVVGDMQVKAMSALDKSQEGIRDAKRTNLRLLIIEEEVYWIECTLREPVALVVAVYNSF